MGYERMTGMGRLPHPSFFEDRAKRGICVLEPGVYPGHPSEVEGVTRLNPSDTTGCRFSGAGRSGPEYCCPGSVSPDAQPQQAPTFNIADIISSIGLQKDVGQPCSQVPNGTTTTHINPEGLKKTGCVSTGRSVHEMSGSRKNPIHTSYEILCCPPGYSEKYRQQHQQERFDRCVAAGYPVTWKSDAPLTGAQAHFAHFDPEGPACHRSGLNRPSTGIAAATGATQDFEVCCHPRNVTLPDPREAGPGTVPFPVTTDTESAEQLAMDRPIPWGWIAVAALGAGALVWFTKR